MPKNKQSPKAGSAIWKVILDPRYTWIVFLVIVLVVYGQTLWFFLGKLDEDLLIIRLTDYLKDLRNLPEAMLKDPYLNEKGSAFYRPLQTFSYMIDSQFFSERGSVFFLTNLLLHTAAGWALFALLLALTKEKSVSFLFAVLYLVDPLFVHAIAWIPARGDLLAGLAGLLAFLFFIRWLETGWWKQGLYSLIAFSAALLSKESSIVIPVLMGLYIVLSEHRRSVSAWPLTILSAGFLGAIGGYFFLRSVVVDIPSPPSDFGLIPLMHNLRAIPEFLAKFLLPFNLAPMPCFSWLSTAVGLCLLLLLMIWVTRSAMKGRYLGLFGFLWFLALTLPGVMYRHSMGSSAYDYLEHRAYLPMAGIILLLAEILWKSTDIRIRKSYFYGLSMLVLILGIYSMAYTRNYRDPERFYDRAIRMNPNSAVAWNNRGTYWANMEEHVNAIDDYDHALAVKPDYALTYLNKGVSLNALNRKQEALKEYEAAIRFDSGLFLAYFNKAGTQLELGLYSDAAQTYTRALALNPAFSNLYLGRGLARYHLNDFSGSTMDFSEVIRLDSGNAVGYLNRGWAWWKSGKKDAACFDWKKAASLGNGDARELLSRSCP